MGTVILSIIESEHSLEAENVISHGKAYIWNVHYSEVTDIILFQSMIVAILAGILPEANVL